MNNNDSQISYVIETELGAPAGSISIVPLKRTEPVPARVYAAFDIYLEFEPGDKEAVASAIALAISKMNEEALQTDQLTIDDVAEALEALSDD